MYVFLFSGRRHSIQAAGCRLLAWILTVLIFEASWRARAEDAGFSLPRYDLKVGQELLYGGDTVQSSGNVVSRLPIELTLWVARRNEDDSWRIIARYSRQNGEKKAASKSVSITVLDVKTNGEFVPLCRITERTILENVLVTLPANEGELLHGWASRPTDGHAGYRFKLRHIPNKQSRDWQITRSKTGRVDDTPQADLASFVFDGTQGVVRQFERSPTPSSGEGLRDVKLKQIRLRDDNWTTNLDRDMTAYAETSFQYDELLDGLDNRNGHAYQVLDEGATLWTQFLDDSSNEMAQEAGKIRLSQHNASRQKLLSEAMAKSVDSQQHGRRP